MRVSKFFFPITYYEGITTDAEFSGCFSRIDFLLPLFSRIYDLYLFLTFSKTLMGNENIKTI